MSKVVNGLMAEKKFHQVIAKMMGNIKVHLREHGCLLLLVDLRFLAFFLYGEMLIKVVHVNNSKENNVKKI